MSTPRVNPDLDEERLSLGHWRIDHYDVRAVGTGRSRKWLVDDLDLPVGRQRVGQPYTLKDVRGLIRRRRDDAGQLHEEAGEVGGVRSPGRARRRPRNPKAATTPI